MRVWWWDARQAVTLTGLFFHPPSLLTQWSNSEVCGMCLRFKGFNKGAGGEWK